MAWGEPGSMGSGDGGVLELRQGAAASGSAGTAGLLLTAARGRAREQMVAQLESAEAAASDCTTVSGFFAMRACGGERWRQWVIQRRDARRFQRQRAARRPHESQRDDGSERALPFAP